MVRAALAARGPPRAYNEESAVVSIACSEDWRKTWLGLALYQRQAQAEASARNVQAYDIQAKLAGYREPLSRAGLHHSPARPGPKSNVHSSLTWVAKNFYSNVS